MRLDKFISASDRIAIEAAVREAESKTSGEIVPAVVDFSSDYSWIGYRSALVGWASASLVVLWLHFSYPYVLEFWETQALQVGGLVFGWIFSRLPFGLRFLVRKEIFAEEVGHAAYESFVRHGLMNTRDRTGVLVFVSLRERRVQILGDKAIHDQVGDAFWAQEVERIAAGIREGKPAEGMIAAIRSIGERLQQHFPRKADDTNELPDSLQTD